MKSFIVLLFIYTQENRIYVVYGASYRDRLNFNFQWWEGIQLLAVHTIENIIDYLLYKSKLQALLGVFFLRPLVTEANER